MILQSLIGTWELRGQDPMTAMRLLLQTPRAPIVRFATV
jgi:hypothetical protein